MSSVKVSFLGTGAGNCIHRAHTAIVLDWEGGPRILLDASSGNSALRHGAMLGMESPSFQQVLLSHHHADHMGGLPHILGQRNMADPDADPLEVHCSESTSAGLARLFHATSITQSVDQDGVTSAQGKRLVNWHPSDADKWIDLGFGVRAKSFQVDHIEGARGWRVERDGLSVVFSGDTRFCENLVEASRGARLLVHEALTTDRNAEAAKARGHSTAGEAARAAKFAGVSQLVITHIDTPFHSEHQPLVEEAQHHYSGPVSVAGDLTQITVAKG